MEYSGNGNFNIPYDSPCAFSNIKNESEVLTAEQIELFNCELCDDHLKKKFLEVKENFFKIFKFYVRLIRFIKNKEENLKKYIEDIGPAQKEFIHSRNLLHKLINLRQLENLKKNLKFENVSEEEKKEFFDQLKLRKEMFKLYKKNVNDLEKILNNIKESLEMVYLSNCIYKND
jgi:hypothetical protein